MNQTDGRQDRWVSVIFLQDDKADEVLEMIEREGVYTAVEHLAQWDYGDETTATAVAYGHAYDGPPERAGDRTVVSGDYALVYNDHLGHAHLLRQIAEPPHSEPKPARRHGPLTAQMANHLHQVEIARAVIQAAESGVGILARTDPEVMTGLRQVIASVEGDVTIPHPNDPFRAPIYEGPAAQAHTMLIPGWYAATSLDGEHEAVVVVGRPATDAHNGISAILPLTEHPGSRQASAAVPVIQRGIGREPAPMPPRPEQDPGPASPASSNSRLGPATPYTPTSPHRHRGLQRE